MLEPRQDFVFVTFVPWDELLPYYVTTTVPDDDSDGNDANDGISKKSDRLCDVQSSSNDPMVEALLKEVSRYDVIPSAIKDQGRKRGFSCGANRRCDSALTSWNLGDAISWETRPHLYACRRVCSIHFFLFYFQALTSFCPRQMRISIHFIHSRTWTDTHTPHRSMVAGEKDGMLIQLWDDDTPPVC